MLTFFFLGHFMKDIKKHEKLEFKLDDWLKYTKESQTTCNFFKNKIKKYSITFWKFYTILLWILILKLLCDCDYRKSQHMMMQSIFIFINYVT
jgi:hypothetical protein